MRVMVLGKDGQLGYELSGLLSEKHDVSAFGRAECDITDTSSLRSLIKHERPDLIINAAAYTAVREAEDDPENAEAINHHAVSVIAEIAKDRGAMVIHYSTDYVFDGEAGRPYTELDGTKPLNRYGTSKRNGELAVLASGADSMIIRTSWLFSWRGKNFVRTVLDRSMRGDELRVVDDQYGSPTSASMVAGMTERLLQDEGRLHDVCASPGIYHLACDGCTTWYGLADHILDEAMRLGMIDRKRLVPITTDELEEDLRRPSCSCLDCSKFSELIEDDMPGWQTCVASTLSRLSE